MTTRTVSFVLLWFCCSLHIFGQSIGDVRFWAYQIQDQNLNNSIQKLADSHYDLLVIDNIRSLKGDENHPNAADVSRLRNSMNPKGGKTLVVCYVDIGEAEEYRYYWKRGWKVGSPEWIVAPDPDGWDENYPVKYWRQEWRDIVFGNDSAMIDLILADGYDGVYLDWVEAFEFDMVDSCAVDEGKDAREEMIRFILDITAYCRSKEPGFIVIPQNATAITIPDDALTTSYLGTISAVAQEDIWFDGEADEHGREGDMPVDPQLTAEYIDNLRKFQNAGLPVLTVDYAEIPVNVDSCYRAAKRLGYLEYVALRQLDRLTDTPPPGLIAHNEKPEEEYGFRLGANYPNPAATNLVVPFQHKAGGQAEITIYDTQGRETVWKYKGYMSPGRHMIHVDVSGLSSGIHYLRIDTENGSGIRSFVKR